MSKDFNKYLDTIIKKYDFRNKSEFFRSAIIEFLDFLGEDEEDDNEYDYFTKIHPEVVSHVKKRGK